MYNSRHTLSFVSLLLPTSSSSNVKTIFEANLQLSHESGTTEKSGSSDGTGSSGGSTGGGAER